MNQTPITVPVVVMTYVSAVHDLEPSQIILVAGNEPMAGYTEVGRSTLTFTPDDRPARIAREVATLRARIQEKRADAEIEARKLEERIANLLALTYEEPNDVA